MPIQGAGEWQAGQAGPPATVGTGEGEMATHGEEHRELVGQVKTCQRESMAWKEMWWDWVKANANGTRDPARLTVGLLKKALSDMGNSTHHLPPNPMMMPVPDLNDPEHEMWVMRVKDKQRSQENFKEDWYKYVRKHGANEKDPKRHTKEFLAGALEYIEKQKQLAERGIKMGADGQPTYPDVAQYFMEDLVTAALNRFDQHGAIPNIQEFITEFIATRSLGGIATPLGQMGQAAPEPEPSNYNPNFPPEKRMRHDGPGSFGHAAPV